MSRSQHNPSNTASANLEPARARHHERATHHSPKAYPISSSVKSHIYANFQKGRWRELPTNSRWRRSQDMTRQQTYSDKFSNGRSTPACHHTKIRSYIGMIEAITEILNSPAQTAEQSQLNHALH
ncbi:hypothetical protein V6N12_022628 [Hibiscus sabdariffa]|uniref:Uncharacterized protein n=1 Tax=Hibiscus sabdariffa TaxID=183260 RepID=A0ABR2FVG2_9ROSI